jgi:CheY-like chemotaxis protein
VDGKQVLAQLQRDPATAGVPVVVLSADANPEQTRRLLAAGARKYLTKPLDLARFLAVVGAILHTAPVSPQSVGPATHPRR